MSGIDAASVRDKEHTVKCEDWVVYQCGSKQRLSTHLDPAKVVAYPNFCPLHGDGCLVTRAWRDVEYDLGHPPGIVKAFINSLEGMK